MTIEKSIGWTDMTLNPIKGKCKGDCWYCWTKPLYKRKFLKPKIMLDMPVFFNIPIRKVKKIFLCSTHDLFGDWIPSWWRDSIFGAVKQFPQHTFQVLTKFPQNIDREMPDNVWLGVSITDMRDYLKVPYLEKAKARIKFLSFEPLLYDGEYPLASGWNELINWIIVGKLTGFGKKYDPHKEQIDKFVRFRERFNIPIFLKENLREIWGKSLIQEFPNEK